MIDRRIALKSLAFAAGAVLAGASFAQGAFPSASTVSLVVPYPAGGPTDALARMVQPTMQQVFGKTTIVENVAGAGGAIGAQKTLSAPDGHLILMGSPNEVILAPLASAGVKYKADDFRVVGLFGSLPYVLVARPDLAPNDIDALIAYARDKANKPLSYGSVGVGSLNHLAGEDFKAQTGVNIYHVPYKGGAPLVQDLMGGQIDIAFTPLAGNVLSLIETKKLKSYGLTTATPSAKFKQLGTVNAGKTLKNFVYSIWVGPVVPAAAPKESIDAIATGLSTVMKSPELRKSIEDAGFVLADAQTPEQAQAEYRKEVDRLNRLAKSINLQAQ